MFKDQKGSSCDTDANGVDNDMEADDSNDENEQMDSVCAFYGTEDGSELENQRNCETMEMLELRVLPSEANLWSLWKYIIRVAQRKRGNERGEKE